LVCTLGVHPSRRGDICVLCTSNICQLLLSKNCFVGYIIITLGLQDKFKKVAGEGFVEEGFWGFNNHGRRGSLMGFHGGAEVCVREGFCGAISRTRRAEVCVREGSCGAVSRKGGAEVCVCGKGSGGGDWFERPISKQ